MAYRRSLIAVCRAGLNCPSGTVSSGQWCTDAPCPLAALHFLIGHGNHARLAINSGQRKTAWRVVRHNGAKTGFLSGQLQQPIGCCGNPKHLVALAATSTIQPMRSLRALAARWRFLSGKGGAGCSCDVARASACLVPFYRTCAALWFRKRHR